MLPRPLRITLIGCSTLLLALLTAAGSLWLVQRFPPASGLAPPSAASGAQLWVADPALLPELASRHLTADQQLGARALLRTWEHRALGPQVTLERDVLPALGASILWWDAPSGSWTLRGTVRAGAAQDLLDALHASFRAGVPPIRRTQLLLDDRFPFDALEATEDAVRDETLQEQGWTIRTMRPAAGSGLLVSARRGQEIVLGNDPAALRLHAAETLTPPAAWRAIAALGALPRPLLSSDLAPVLLPDAIRTTLREGSGALIPWSLRQREDGWALTTP